MWRFGSLARAAALALALAVSALTPPRAGVAETAAPRDETPLADVLDVIVTGREVVAIGARDGGSTAIRLRLEEAVLWTGARGKVGLALTDQRALAVATRSAGWRQAPYQAGEVPPKSALLGDRVAVVVTSRRAFGFNGETGDLVEYPIGPQETVLATRVGERVAVVVTDRFALGLSPASGGFSKAALNLHEHIEKVTARANLATVTTSRRILIFSGSTGSWEERNLDLR